MDRFIQPVRVKWQNWKQVQACSYQCGYCGSNPAPASILEARTKDEPHEIWGFVLVCGNCGQPTFFRVEDGYQMPPPLYGYTLKHVPDEINNFYEQARECIGACAWDAVAMLCRTIIMYVACEQGLVHTEKLTFQVCVKYLVDQHIVPSSGGVWVDMIRTIGNSAAHKLDPTNEVTALLVMDFTYHLLANVYENVARAQKYQDPNGQQSTLTDPQ